MENMILLLRVVLLGNEQTWILNQSTGFRKWIEKGQEVFHSNFQVTGLRFLRLLVFEEVLPTDFLLHPFSQKAYQFFLKWRNQKCQCQKVTEKSWNQQGQSATPGHKIIE